MAVFYKQTDWRLAGGVFQQQLALLTAVLFLDRCLVLAAETELSMFRFSFHKDGSQPRQLGSGLWNCSGRDWPDFQQHVQCNYRVECGDRRDEAHCPYTSQRCGPGLVAYGPQCLFILPKRTGELSWEEAYSLCEQRGGRMANFKTHQDLFSAADLLRLTHFVEGVFYIGLRKYYGDAKLFPYRNTYMWSDETVTSQERFVQYLKGGLSRRLGDKVAADPCAVIIIDHEFLIGTQFGGVECSLRRYAPVTICESVHNHTTSTSVHQSLLIPPRASYSTTYNIATVTCSAGYLTHEFLACDVSIACFSRDDEEGDETCDAPLTPLPPFLTCTSGREQRVPYTLVCDHRPDCADSSDEDFCHFPECDNWLLSCEDSQCIPTEKRCNGLADCKLGAAIDERQCPSDFVDFFKQLALKKRGVVDLDKRGEFVQRNRPTEGGGVWCPETHFQCTSQDYCLPIFLRCNGVKDCLQHEDEADCDEWKCPGLYRCRQSQVCLHPRDVCDGNPHCPQHDDEVMCNVTCPRNCQCRGMAFFCAAPFPVQSFPQLRYLDASGSTLETQEVSGSPLLVFLNLSRCGLTRLHDLTLLNLLYLDVSRNQLTSFSASTFVGVPQVRQVSLARNPLLRLMDSGQHSNLTWLDLSGVPVPRLNASVLAAFPNLQRLNLSGSGVTSVVDEGFQRLTQLRQVDLRGCPVSHVPALMFQSVERLEKVYADSFWLCCPALLPPGFKVRECEAPADELSSCEDLLGSYTYTVLIFVFALLTLVGNCASFLFRTVFSRSKSKLGFGVFVTHLCVSDFLMGVYLLIIGVADRMYTGRYLWNDFAWRHSVACTAAGFLSLLSSEVSALSMCLITVDRFLVLRFPFSRWHFGVTSACIASLVVWVTGLVLVSVPLLSETSHWEFYSQSSICVPLPITRKDFAGRVFSFSVVIVLNFILFIIICCGQLVIYLSVRASAMSVGNTNRKNKDLTIARRLITVAMSDFLCWFPIGCLGLLASRGVPIPGEVNVAVAVLVMPINSALNPFLYTLNVLMERRRLAREDQLRKHIMAQLKAAAD